MFVRRNQYRYRIPVALQKAVIKERVGKKYITIIALLEQNKKKSSLNLVESFRKYSI